MQKDSWGYAPSISAPPFPYGPARVETGSVLKRLVAALLEWRRRASTRRLLATIDERTLRDIGMTRMSASFEANKPFWRD